MTKAKVSLLAELESRIRFETLISDISSLFVKLPPNKVDSEIERALKRILDFFGVDRCGLLGVRENDNFVWVTHISHAEGIEPVSKDINLAILFPWCYEKLIRQGQPVIVSQMADLPPEAWHDRGSWSAQGTQSNLTIPLFSSQGVRYLLAIQSAQKECDWPNEFVPRLKMIGEIFVNALERRKSDLALRESESRRARLISTGDWNELIIQKEKNTQAVPGVYENRGGPQYVFPDDRLRRLLGIPEKQIPRFYEFWVEHLHPDDRERVIALRCKIHENGLDHAFSEYRYLHPQQGLLWLNHVVHVLEREPQGRVLRLVGMIWDVTENKRTEEIFEQSRIEITALMNSTDDLIWSVDPERFGLLSWNKALHDYYFNIHGIEIAIGMSPDQLLPPDYALQWRNFYEIALRDGSCITEYVTLSRTNVWLFSLHVLKRGDKVFGISVFGKGISQIKQVEWKLRDSEERLNLATESAGIGLWGVDMQTHQVWVTPKLREMFNFAPDEDINGGSILKVIHPEDQELVRQALKHTLQTKDELRVDFRVVLPGRKIRWMSVRGRLYFKSSGEQDRLMGVSIDITDRKHAEKKLLASQEAMRTFTGRLLTIQEEERRRLARELHDDFTQRLAVLAMDISKLEVSSKPIDKTIGAGLKHIKDQIVLLSTDIHDVSRQLHPSIIDDLGLGRAIGSECANFTRRTGIIITCRLTNIPRTISRDSSVVLFRVTQESLRNIHKHAKVGEAEVILAGGDNQISLTIHDCGAGFDRENSRQAHGLGLFSMEERVQSVRGIFKIDSAPGQGTTVKVTIPLQKE